MDDNVLRELARLRPTTPAALRKVPGLGEKRLKNYSNELLEILTDYCESNPEAKTQGSESALPVKGKKADAFRLFKMGASIETIMESTTRKRSTVLQYLVEYILQDRPEHVQSWVSEEAYRVIAEALNQAAETEESPKLTPLYEAFQGRYSYDALKIVRAHARPRARESNA